MVLIPSPDCSDQCEESAQGVCSGEVGRLCGSSETPTPPERRQMHLMEQVLPSLGVLVRGGGAMVNIGDRTMCTQVDTAKLLGAVRMVLLNQLLLSLPMVLLMFPVMRWRGSPCGPELPSFHWVLLELCCLGLLEEVLFYYSHRLFHHPTLYRHFHKKHHEWTAPIGIISLYAHPIEHLFSNMLPIMVGPILLRSHVATVMLWFSLALLISTISHCGYHLPLLPSPEFHDFHHLRFNQCFGVLGVLDRLHQTDTAFRASSAYERHTLLLGLDPLSETIPDSPKRK